MESEVIQTFNKALVSMQDNKSGVVSKQKVFEITKAAMSAVRYFKHVVFIIERYLVKCRPEYKVPALYVMDSILRQAKKQYKHKDVFAPRFALNLTNTISNVLTCVSEDRPKVVRVVNLWLAHQVFSEEAIEPVLQHCRASGLEVEPARVEALVKGEKADIHLYNQSAGSADHSFASSGGSIKKETVSKTPVEKRSPGIPPPPAPQQPAGHATSRAEPPSAHHPQSLEERLSQFSRQKLGGAPPPPLQRTNSQQHTGTSTPRTVESGPKTPPLEDQDHRVSTGQFSTGRKESHQNGAGLSAVDVNALLGAGQMGAEALGRVQKFLNSRIQESLEIERRHQCNIKNLLAREFDYSDEEDEGGSASAQHGGPAQQLSTMGRDALVQAARQLLANATVQQEIQRLVMDQPPPPQQPRPAAFQMPDFSVPPPGAPPRFLPPQMTFASLPPPGVMPQMPIGFAPNIPPPGIFGAQQPQQQAAVRDDRDQQRRDRDRGEQRQGDRERSGSDGRRPPIRAPSRERERSHTSGSGRKRTREWSPSEEGRGRRERSRERSRERGESTRRGSSGRGERDERSDRVRRERDQSAEERERAKRQREEQREQAERERRRIGLPSKPKEDHVLIASRTLWFGRCPVNCTEADIVEAVKEVATPEKISIVGARGCAYVTMPDRKSAFKIIDRMAKQLQVAKKNVKLDWATISGLKDDVALREDYWDLERGLAQIPYGKLPGGSVDALLEGAWLDVDTLPAHLKDKYTNTGLKANLVQQQQLTAQQQLATALIPVPASAAAGPFQLISAQGQMMPAIMTAPIFSQAAAMNLAVAANLAAAANLQQQFSFPPPQLTQQPQQGGTGATKESGGFANAGFGSVTPTGGTGFGQQPQQQYGSGSGFGGRGGGGDWRGRGRGGGRGGTGYTPRFAGTPDAGRGRGGGPGGGYRGGAGRGRGWAGAEHSGGGAGEWGGGGAGGGYRGGTAGRGRGWSGGDGTGDFGGRSNSFSAAHQQQQSSDSEGNLAVATITATQQQNEIHKQEAPKNSGAPPTVAQTAVPSETETELPPGCD